MLTNETDYFRLAYKPRKDRQILEVASAMAILHSTLERVDRGKMNLQLIANEENKNSGSTILSWCSTIFTCSSPSAP